MKYTFTVLLLCTLGCSSGVHQRYQDYLDLVPNNKFDLFHTKVTGIGAAGSITAKKCSKTDSELIIKSLEINAEAGLKDIHVLIEGYRREIQ